jgi:pimeloyl-ACP methyl ester carboxylesterase
VRVLLLALTLGAFQAQADASVMRRKVVTEDGVSLALYRYVPIGGGGQSPPVVLIADLTLGREAFDVAGEGLAPWLQSRGREVFVAELRGHGRSGTPKSWGLQEIVTRDLPAIFAAVTTLRPGRVDLVAHGWAGTLALVATTRELEGQVGRVLALNTPVEPGPAATALEDILSRGGGFGRLALEPSGAATFERLYAKHAVLPPGRLDTLRGTGLSSLGAKASGELLSWMRTGDLPIGGSSVRERLGAYDRPTQLVLAQGNSFANPEFASVLRDLAPNASVSIRLLSRLQLMREDYSHLSMLHGRGALLDVFVPALAFLDGLPLPATLQAGDTP